MIKLRGVHTLDHAQIVRTRGEVGQEVGKPHASLSVPHEGSFAPHERRAVLFKEGKAHLLKDRRIHFFPVELIQLRLVVEEVQLGGSTCHEKKDAALCPRSEVSEGASGGAGIRAKHVRQSHAAKSTG